MSSCCLIVLLIITFFTFIHASQSSIKLENNGYNGIVVSFSPDIPSSNRENMIREMMSLWDESSKLLFESTHKRAFFQEVTFLIPKSWPLSAHLTKEYGVKKTRIQSVSEADFVLKPPAQAFLDNPMTIQFEGCGRQGMQVQLSTKFMTEPSLSLRDRSKILINNWAKYRYGVFDEHGFLGDRLYPLYWSTPGVHEEDNSMGFHGVKITSCVATDTGRREETIRSQNETSSGAPCSLRTNPSTGFPQDNDCIPFPLEEGNGQVISSLMSHPTLSKNRYFCDASTHNPRAPNKHNNLCQGLSVSQVINRHPDFIDVRTRTDLKLNETQVRFKFVQEEDPRVTFIVDTDSRRMEKNSISAALKRFKSHVLHSQSSQLLILDLKDNSQVHIDQLSPRFVKSEDFITSVWGRETEGAFCLSCVIKKMEDAVNGLYSNQDTTSELVIITRGEVSDQDVKLDSVARILLEREISLKVILYPYHPQANTLALRELVSKVRGNIFFVSPSSPTISSQMKLFDAFDSLLTNSAELLLGRQEFDPNTKTIDFEFEVDQSVIGPKTELVAQLFSSNDREDYSGPSFSLFAPNNSKTFTTKSSEYQETGNRFVVSLKSASLGKWRLHFNRKHNDSLMIAVAYIRTNRNEEVITTKCFISEATTTTPPAVHVLLSQNGHFSPVQGAHLEVTLTNDKGIPYNNARNLPLFDDGLANPDITHGDGIYSRYLSEASAIGYYGVHVRVRSGVQTRLHSGSPDVRGLECCGSSVPKPTRLADHSSKSVSHLDRIISCGFLHVREAFNPEDFVERISDLKVESVNLSDRQVGVSFTPPSSPSTSISVRIFSDSQYDHIRENFEDGRSVLGSPGLDSLSSSLDRRTYTYSVAFPSAGIYHLAIKVTGSNDRSTVSNMVSFFMSADPATLTTESDDPSSQTTRYPSSGSLKSLEPWLMIAFMVSGIVLCVILTASICCFCRCQRIKGSSTEAANPPTSSEKKKNKKNNAFTNGLHSNLTIQTTMGSHDNVVPEKITPSSGNSSNVIKYGHPGVSSGSDGHLNHQYHGYVDGSTMIDSAYTQLPVSNTINPFGHVPADFLISHYDKVKQARSLGLPPPVISAEQVAKNQDGSCFTGSDNDRPSSDSYDENTMTHGGHVSGIISHSPSHHHLQQQYNNMDWSYENVGYHAQPAYVHYNQPVSYQDQGIPSYYAQIQTPLPTHGIHDPSALTTALSPTTTSQHHVVWQEGSSHPYLPRSQTPTSDNSSNNHYPSDPRFSQRRSTTVSQV